MTWLAASCIPTLHKPSRVIIPRNGLLCVKRCIYVLSEVIALVGIFYHSTYLGHQILLGRKFIIMTWHKRHNVSNQWLMNCLLNSLPKLWATKTSTLRATGPLWMESTKWPLMWPWRHNVLKYLSLSMMRMIIQAIWTDQYVQYAHHNERDGVSNQRLFDCLLHHLFKCR